MLVGGLFLTGKIVKMPDLLAPNTLLADNGRLYIADGTSIYIYSLSDLSLQKKFGREGEGPQEFKEKIYTLGIQGEYITVNSVSKLSFFTKEGDFTNVIQTPPQNIRFMPVKEKFTGIGILVDNKAMYQTINIYNSDLAKEKEIARLEHEIQPGKGLKVFHATLSVAVSEDKIFSAGAKHFVINVYNEKGEKILMISRQYERKKVTERDKNRLIEYLQTNPETKEYYEILKPVKFAAYYPALKDIIAADKKLYALTWKAVNGNTECYVFDFSGKLVQTTFLPIKNRDAVNFSPLTIKNGKLYQLVENENSKKWELHVTDIQ
jgi:hypothetical protein